MSLLRTIERIGYMGADSKSTDYTYHHSMEASRIFLTPKKLRRPEKDAAFLFPR